MGSDKGGHEACDVAELKQEACGVVGAWRGVRRGRIWWPEDQGPFVSWQGLCRKPAGTSVGLGGQGEAGSRAGWQGAGPGSLRTCVLGGAGPAGATSLTLSEMAFLHVPSSQAGDLGGEAGLATAIMVALVTLRGRNRCSSILSEQKPERTLQVPTTRLGQGTCPRAAPWRDLADRLHPAGSEPRL